MLIRFSKTDQLGAGCVITIPESSALTCPVRAAVEYTNIRPFQGDAYFRRFDTTPLSRYEFNKVLRNCIGKLGLPIQCYTSHSFRIGGATAAAMRGYSNEQIKIMGRWSSDSFRRYIRVEMQ